MMVRMYVDDGRGLLNTCLDGDWGKAEDLIQSGSHLEARSQVCVDVYIILYVCVYSACEFV